MTILPRRRRAAADAPGPGSARIVRRTPVPPALLVTTGCAAAAALTVLVTQVYMLVTGRDFLIDSALDSLGLGGAAGDTAHQVLGPAADRAYGDLRFAAVLCILAACGSLVSALLALRGLRTGQLLVALFMLVTAGSTMLSISYVFPVTGRVICELALGMIAVGVVAAFQPSVNDYIHAGRGAARVRTG